MSGFHIEGLEELQEKISTIKNKAPDRIIEQLDTQGKKLRKAIKANTPVGISKRKKLKNSFKLKPVERTNGGFSKGLHSNALHYHLIERGHKGVTPGGKQIGWVSGTFFLEKTTLAMETPMMIDMRKWLDELFVELR